MTELVKWLFVFESDRNLCATMPNEEEDTRVSDYFNTPVPECFLFIQDGADEYYINRTNLVVAKRFIEQQTETMDNNAEKIDNGVQEPTAAC